MIDFLLGALAAVVLYTFFPALAVYPSNWTKAAWRYVTNVTHGPKE